MGYVKEPRGVDFVIASDPLTDIARQEISEFIRNYKTENVSQKTISRNITTLRKTKFAKA
jgi:site-specific recombinase XerD